MTKSVNELRAYLEERLKHNYFIQHMGIELQHLETGLAELNLHVQEHHLQQNGFTHGGVTATLCDVATGIAAYTVVAEGKNVVTVDLKISYLNPSVSKKIRTEGKVVKSGNFLIFCEGRVFDVFEDGTEKPVAACTSIMAAVDTPLKS
jgi:uncharacterized protein (TIGR00369 family)